MNDPSVQVSTAMDYKYSKVKFDYPNERKI
jgi:hypothetical protein